MDNGHRDCVRSGHGTFSADLTVMNWDLFYLITFFTVTAVVLVLFMCVAVLANWDLFDLIVGTLVMGGLLALLGFACAHRGGGSGKE